MTDRQDLGIEAELDPQAVLAVLRQARQALSEECAEPVGEQGFKEPCADLFLPRWCGAPVAALKSTQFLGRERRSERASPIARRRMNGYRMIVSLRGMDLHEEVLVLQWAPPGL